MSRFVDDQAWFPDQITRILEDVSGWLRSAPLSHDETVRFSSLYGLLLGSAYSLCSSYNGLIDPAAPFHPSSHYFKNVRLNLHSHMVPLAAKGDSSALGVEPVILHINVAQHLLHFLMDRLLNALIQKCFRPNKLEMSLIYYQFTGLRIASLRARLAKHERLGPRFEALDRAFSRWSRRHEVGTCNDFVLQIVDNREMKDQSADLAALVAGVRLTLGNHAGDVAGSLAYIIDRTNEAKHLPDGAGRAQLAAEQLDAEGIRMLYEVEWVVTWLAFIELARFAREGLGFLCEGGVASPADQPSLLHNAT